MIEGDSVPSSSRTVPPFRKANWSASALTPIRQMFCIAWLLWILYPLEALRAQTQSCGKVAHVAWSRGNSFLRAGELDVARVCFERSLRLDSTLSKAHADLGVVQVALGEVEQAEFSFRRALKFDSNDANARLNLVQLLVRSGQIDDAEDIVSRVDITSIESHETVGAFGQLLERAGKDSLARVAYERQSALNPKDVAGRMRLALLLVRTEKCVDALPVMREIVSVRRDFANVWGGLAVCSFRLNRHAEAIAFWDTATNVRSDFFEQNPGQTSMYARSLKQLGLERGT